MAIPAKQKQKKLERKNRKKAIIKKSLRERLQLRGRASAYADFPIHECLVPDGLFETGLGNIFVARRAPDGAIAVGFFLVDVYCLGVKDAYFRVLGEDDYEHRLKSTLMQEGQRFEKVHVACAKKLIEGALRYARELGFSPHSDYRKAKGIFDNIEADACPVRYEYGREGKPFYVKGPYESTARARAIIDQLDKRCGTGNYDYLVITGERPLL